MLISNLYFQWMSLFLIILLIIIYFSKSRIKNVETKIFQVIIITTFIGVILDIASTYIAYVNVELTIVKPLCKTYLLFLLLYMYLLGRYIFEITKKTPTTKVQLIIYTTANVLVAVASLLLPIYNHVENHEIFTYGPSTEIVYAMAATNIIFYLISIVINLKTISIKKFIPVLSFIILMIFSTILQNTNPEVLIVTAASVFVTAIMYFTIENPDVKMIEQLDKAKKEAERANQAKTDFLSSMSHEVRTPLNAIVGFSEFIKTEDNLDKAKADADDILMASQNLLEIVNGILDISKIEADKMEIVNQEYELLPHLENIIKMVKPRIKDKPINLKYSFAKDLPATMYGDVTKVKQAITNLMTNAAKYTESGEIGLTVNCINHQTYSTLVVIVKDTGRGIKQEQINKLFTKFNRLDEDKNSTLEGTGLGLAITKKFVEMLGGKVVVQSEYGKGSTFIVYLNQRIVSLTNGVKKQNTEIKEYKFPGSKVLVVDDNPLNLKVGEKLLSKYEINAVSIDNGQSCIDNITNGEKYDLILLDDMMPNMRGGEVLKKLKQIPNFGIPTVALTANAISGMRDQYLQSGFDDYLSKPIELPMIEAVLSRFLQKKEIVTTFKPQYKVLIVDDNSLNIKIASKLLSVYNFDITSVLSGQECIDTVRQNNAFDLIFMDIMMPSMSGVETFKQLKTVPNFKTPVVVLTADAVKGARESYLQEGFNDYITKPLDKKLLHEILCTYLELESCPTNSNKTVTVNLDEHGINSKQAIELLGDKETYNEMLKEFVKNIETTTTNLTAYKTTNLPEYSVLVHSLKSDSKYLGFIKLAELAYNHELKGKENNQEYIETNFKELIEEVNRIIIVVKKYLNV